MNKTIYEKPRCHISIHRAFIWNTYFMYHTKFSMLNDLCAIRWRVEYLFIFFFSFLKMQCVYADMFNTILVHPLFLVMYIHLWGCQKILNLGEMVCLAHQICDWWLGSMGRCLLGRPFKLEYSSLAVLCTSTLWGGQVFLFPICCDWALVWKLLPETTNATPNTIFCRIWWGVDG